MLFKLTTALILMHPTHAWQLWYSHSAGGYWGPLDGQCNTGCTPLSAVAGDFIDWVPSKGETCCVQIYKDVSCAVPYGKPLCGVTSDMYYRTGAYSVFGCSGNC